MREHGVKRAIAKELIRDAKSIKSKKKGMYEQVEQCLVMWIQQLRSQNVSVNGEHIKTQAAVFSEKLGIVQACKWSDGWLNKFKLRVGMKFVTLNGEAADAGIPSILFLF